MNFALELLRSNFGHITCTAGGHERKDLLEDVLQIVVLRNPYDTITSGAERYLDTSNHKGMPKEETINISNIEAVGYQIAGEEERYFEFFKDIESFNNIKILSFELLTENPKKFINKAHDRNYIKRCMREGIRKNKALLEELLILKGISVDIAMVYICRDRKEADEIELKIIDNIKKIKNALQKPPA